MHVLFLADGLFPFVVGGMQKHSTMLIKHLSPLVDQITVCTCGVINAAPPSNQELLNELVTTKDNLEVRSCTYEDRGHLPGHYLRANRKLSQTFLDLAGDLSQYDCIYAQGLTGNAFLGKHPRLMVNLHGLNMFQSSFSWKEELGKWAMRPLFRKQIQQTWKAVSLGGKLSDILFENGAKREQVVVLPNGVDDFWWDSPRARRNNAGIRFLMVGRNDPAKGYHVLEAALNLMQEAVEIHFVGDWLPIESTHHKLTYHGVVRDKHKMMDIMDSCDVLLLPSLSEGMPTVVLEAKARGLQVIGTDVGAMSDLQRGLIPPGNAQALADSIRRCIKEADQPHLPTRFKWEEIARDTLSAMQS